ncbi:MAG: class I SAM-dependent methyltransferase, partial [Acidimicrobiales bacterium]
MASEWTADHDSVERSASVIDAFERGGVADGLVLELGSGTGLGTRVLRELRRGPIVALDLAAEMLQNAPAHYGERVRADSAALPIRDASVSVVVLVNALLFPAEVDRVLAPGGAVVWVNTLGDQPPI